MTKYVEGEMLTFQCPACKAVTAHKLKFYDGLSWHWFFTCVNCDFKTVEVDRADILKR